MFNIDVYFCSYLNAATVNLSSYLYLKLKFNLMSLSMTSSYQTVLKFFSLYLYFDSFNNFRVRFFSHISLWVPLILFLCYGCIYRLYINMNRNLSFLLQPRFFKIRTPIVINTLFFNDLSGISCDEIRIWFYTNNIIYLIEFIVYHITNIIFYISMDIVYCIVCSMYC